ncbi:hypothetical protein ElyMa_006595800 [Elysia marginata]|uniref:Uncharacterized protein n=1 Tax=Elysia marginata TaxID=1093978 RepID=A0AAV4IDX2_9GAST|nr:hypothetical protein ElyMa_006595800 [Elysia marginata]
MKQKSVTVSGATTSGKTGPLHPLHSLLHPFAQNTSKSTSSGLGKKGKELTPSSSFLLGTKNDTKPSTLKYTMAAGGRTLLFDTTGSVEKRGNKYDNSHVPTVKHNASGVDIVSFNDIFKIIWGQRGRVVSASESRSRGRGLDSRQCHVAVALKAIYPHFPQSTNMQNGYPATGNSSICDIRLQNPA